MKIVYFGSPTFAVIPLQKLIEAGLSPALVVCQPPKPVGRAQQLEPCAVQAYAEAQGVVVATPNSLKNNAVFVQTLEELRPDVFVVAAYGKLIPEGLLAIPRYGAVNIHPSRLPLFRGASPLQMSIASGATETAVSLMAMDAEMDHGAIYTQIPDRILAEDTAETLGVRLFTAAGNALPTLLQQLETGAILATPQDHAAATFTKLLEREDGHVDWTSTAALVDAKRRGFTPWPGIWTMFQNGKALKILLGKPLAPSCAGTHPGELHAIQKALHIGTSSGCYELLEVQPEGGSRMPAAAFLNGNSSLLGTTCQ